MGTRRPASEIAVVLTVLVGAAPLQARAQGFGLNDIGSCTVGRAYATTGAPCRDASTIVWNPGVAATLPGFSVYAGGAAIKVSGGFTADTTLTRTPSNAPWAVPPHVFLNYGGKLGQRSVAAGIGVYVPYGLTSQWPQNFPGRFEASKAHIATVYIQPNFAIEVVPHILTIGGGPVIAHSSIELRQSLDLSTANAAPGVTLGELGFAQGTEFGRSKLTASATAYGFTIGGQLRPTSDWQIGARFLSPLTFAYDNGTVTFTQVPTGLILAGGNPLGLPAGTPLDSVLAPQFRASPLVTQGVKTRITHPLQAEAGIGYTGIRQTTLDVDYEYVGWQAFKTLPITFTGPAAAVGLNRVLFQDFRASWSVRGSAEHVFGDSARGITGRVGYGYVHTPAPDVTVTPLLPDMDRYNGGLGVGIPVSNAVGIDVGYLHVFTRGRRGRIVERTDRAQTAQQLNSGFYDLAADVFSASLRLHF